MAISGNTMADPPLMYFGRIVMIRVFVMFDTAAAFHSGQAAGAFEGLIKGMALAEAIAQQGSGEEDPPSLGTLVPTPGTAPGSPGGFSSVFATAKNTPIVIPILDTESDMVFVVLSVRYGDETLWLSEPQRRVWETVYSGRPGIDGAAGYQEGYADNSSVSGTGDPGVGFTFSVRKDGGWPARNGLAMPVAIRSQGVDKAGNVLA